MYIYMEKLTKEGMLYLTIIHGRTLTLSFMFQVRWKGIAIVVEVKGKFAGNYQKGICKDIETLSKFTENKHYYKLGVLIIYNYTIDEFWEKTGEFLKDKLQENKVPTDKIIIICKKCKSIPSDKRMLNELLEEVDNGRA